MDKEIIVALAGNPNSGKTTVFNEVTGARQHVGNYPGVTVEKKTGCRKHKERSLRIVDLPGIYSLSTLSAEEQIARQYLIEEKPDIVVDIIDSSNLERNLYLAVQLKELGVPLILAFNMSDVAKSKGIELNIGKLSKSLGTPIVQTIGCKGKGINELLDTILESVANNRFSIKDTSFAVDYGQTIETEITNIRAMLKRSDINVLGMPDRWFATKLLEGDDQVLDWVKEKGLDLEVAKIRSRLESEMENDISTVMASARYAYIESICKLGVKSSVQRKHSFSDRLDAVFTNRILSIPIFLAMMYLVFQFTFTVGDPAMGWIEDLFGWLEETVEGWWSEGSESLLKSLLVDGIIGGVGGVVIFLPNILLLFLAIAFLEDSGYMARAAFIMDRFMNKIGLHGKSFIPMLIGFGCSVPAIMATRTLENKRDRITTMLVVPLMSCGARLPIYALLIPIFFPTAWRAPMLWIIYLIGVALAIICAKLIRSTLLKGEVAPFVMELPPYRMPTLKGILTHMWERGWLYLKKAGTVILGISIVLWAMTTFPRLSEERALVYDSQRVSIEELQLSEAEASERLLEIDNLQAEEELKYSIAGRLGNVLEPLLKPMGFDWKIGTALIGAFAAKEVFVAQMGIVYSVGEADEESESLRAKLKETYNPLIGFCIMLFCLISAPCMATIAVTKRESNSWGWAIFQLVGLTVMAYVLTLIVYQVGVLFQIGIG